MKIYIFLLFISSRIFAIGDYAKGHYLYNWKNSIINIRLEANTQSEIITTISFGELCIVVDDECKKHPFSVQELPPEKPIDEFQKAFQGYVIKGFWVKVKLKSGIIGYVFDGYLSKLKPSFELTESYFEKSFKLIKATSKKYPKSISDGAFSKNKFYKNGSYIIENGGNYDGHYHYFIPTITVEEGYFIMLKTQPNTLELGKSAGDDTTTIQFIDGNLTFSSTLEAISVTKIKYKGFNGVQISFEGWD
jgi:Bacterial SH3 domain